MIIIMMTEGDVTLIIMIMIGGDVSVHDDEELEDGAAGPDELCGQDN